MKRSFAIREGDVARLLGAARRVFDHREQYIAPLVRCTGLSPEGVAAGFACLEHRPSPSDVRSLIEQAGDAQHVHVILSANVFVAPLRALVLARAAGATVTVRASPRDPVLTEALVDAAQDPAVSILTERDPSAIEADVIHVYGRDETIAEVKARVRKGVLVHGHGSGMGVAVVTEAPPPRELAKALADDVGLFDQRGCLSARVVLALGDAARAVAVAEALHRELGAYGHNKPRGALAAAECEAARRWTETFAFAGQVWTGPHHAVALSEGSGPLLAGPAGRHVHVAAVDSLADAAAKLAPLARYVVAVGTDDPARVAPVCPPHARMASLGRMQHPPLDGPVDRRRG